MDIASESQARKFTLQERMAPPRTFSNGTWHSIDVYINDRDYVLFPNLQDELPLY